MKQVTTRLPSLIQVFISLGLFLLLAFSFTAKLDLQSSLRCTLVGSLSCYWV